MRNIFTLLLALTLVTGMNTMALAQSDQHEDQHNDEDYSTTPLIQPTLEDFAPLPVPEVGPDGKPVIESPIGVNSYFEMSDKLKVFSLTPNYRFSDKFAVKARLPYIIERKREYYNNVIFDFDEESSSGFGDMSLEGEYTHKFGGKSKLLRFLAAVKLPTGDNENVVGENEVRIPLGTGSVDMMLRGLYTHSSKEFGLLASALFRINASGESVYQTIDPIALVTSTETVTQTNGNEFVASVFGRHVLGNGIWLNLGTSIMMTGNGEEERQLDSFDPSTSELRQKSTLLDLYPGVSYKFGPLTPYLGARIPVLTSYDDEFRAETRNTVFIFQVTYRPFSMVD